MPQEGLRAGTGTVGAGLERTTTGPPSPATSWSAAVSQQVSRVQRDPTTGHLSRATAALAIADGRYG